MEQDSTWSEEYTVDGDSLVAKVLEIIQDGKVRRILVRDAEGKKVFNIPLWLGAVAVFKNPGILLLGALLSRRESYTLTVLRAR